MVLFALESGWTVEAWVLFALLVLFAVLSCVGIGAAYRNGVTDGYGYAVEPTCPGYGMAGRFLRAEMAHRWPELAGPADVPLTAAHLDWCCKIAGWVACDDGSYRRVSNAGGTPFTLAINPEDGCDGTFVYDVNEDRPVSIRSPDTVGEFRRLCAALEVPCPVTFAGADA